MTDIKVNEERVLKAALQILERRFTRSDYISSPQNVKAYLQMKLAQEEREVFGVVFLDTRHGVLDYKELFFGTIDGASVYPREVVKVALELNAAAVIFVHNHPSGTPDPSEADKRITKRLQDACNLVDIRTLDHFIVCGAQEPYSFALNGLM